jgi:hypothetical protein
MQNNPAEIKAIGALDLSDLARALTNVAVFRAVECAISAREGVWFEIDDRRCSGCRRRDRLRQEFRRAQKWEATPVEYCRQPQSGRLML